MPVCKGRSYKMWSATGSLSEAQEDTKSFDKKLFVGEQISLLDISKGYN